MSRGDCRGIGFLQTTAVAALLDILIGCGPSDQGPAGMVFIPGGEFKMVSEANFAFPNEKPVHRVQVAPFFLDVQAEIEKQGGHCDLVALEGGRHGSPFEDRFFPTTLQAMDAFLESLGYLAQPLVN